jgi:hypothetical protein
MAKYLILWEADEARIPDDPGARKAGWLAAIGETKKDLESGVAKDWGGFIGQANGFTIAEGTEQEINQMAFKYVPFFRFQIIPFDTLDNVEEVVKNIA